MKKDVYKISGLDCAACALELEEKIADVDGVENASISFMSEKLTIELDETRENEIIEKVKKVIKKEEPDVTIEKLVV